MALPKANRLKRREDFKEVYQRGRRRTGQHFKVLALRQGVSAAGFRYSKQTNAANTPHPRPTTPNREKVEGEESKRPTRIGISISQKVSKLAVIRNRIKRQIRAAVRHMLPRISPGWLVVIVVLQGAQECDYAQILRELEQLLVEAEVLNEH